MLIRTTDPFRDLDRLAQQVLGTTNRPAVMPMDAFSRQLVLGDNLDLAKIQAGYEGGVLRLRVPVAEQAKPRKIQINSGADADRASIEA